jgi:hypothetical protein
VSRICHAVIYAVFSSRSPTFRALRHRTSFGSQRDYDSANPRNISHCGSSCPRESWGCPAGATIRPELADFRESDHRFQLKSISDCKLDDHHRSEATLACLILRPSDRFGQVKSASMRVRSVATPPCRLPEKGRGERTARPVPVQQCRVPERGSQRSVFTPLAFRIDSPLSSIRCAL